MHILRIPVSPILPRLYFHRRASSYNMYSMTNTLHTSIVRLDSAGSTRYTLPAPPVALGTKIGLLIFALSWESFSIFWICIASGFLDPHRRAQGFPLPGLGFGCFGLPFVLIGLLLLGAAFIQFLPSRTEVTVDGDTLTILQVNGPIRRTKRVAINTIRELRVDQINASINFVSRTNTRPTPAPVAILIETGAGRPVPIGSGHPRDFLLAFAGELGQSCAIAAPRVGQTAPIAVVDVPPQAVPDPQNPTVTELPAGSNIQFMPTPDGFTLMLPPIGFRRSKQSGLLFFGIIWLGFIVLFTLLMIFGKPSPKNHQPIWIGFLFLIPFWAVGIGILCAAIQLALRRAVLVADADTLVFTQKGPIRSTEKQWPRSQISAVRVDASGTEVNDRPLIQLQLLNPQGKKLIGLFTGRPLDELEYLASQLRQSLNVPANV